MVPFFAIASLLCIGAIIWIVTRPEPQITPNPPRRPAPEPATWSETRVNVNMPSESPMPNSEDVATIVERLQQAIQEMDSRQAREFRNQNANQWTSVTVTETTTTYPEKPAPEPEPEEDRTLYDMLTDD